MVRAARHAGDGLFAARRPRPRHGGALAEQMLSGVALETSWTVVQLVAAIRSTLPQQPPAIASVKQIHFG
jgi:hypothetical protein